MFTRPSLNAMSLAIAGLALTTAAPLAAASSFEWIGNAATGNWSSVANWNGAAPLGGLDTRLVFDSATRPTSFNDFVGGLVLNGLTIGANAGVLNLSGQALIFSGSAAFLAMQANPANTDHSRITNALRLDADLRVAGSSSFESQLFLTGPVSGIGALRLDSGLAVLRGLAGYAGNATVGSGAIMGLSLVDTAPAAGARLTVEAGAQLQLLRVSDSAGTVVKRPIALAGLLSTSTLNGPLFESATVTGAVTLTGAASIHSFGAKSDSERSDLRLTGTLDRAGHALTLSTGGAGNTVRLTQTLVGDGELLLQAGGGNLIVAGVSGNGGIRASGPAGQANITGLVTGSHDVYVSGGTLVLGGLSNTFSGLIRVSGAGTLQATNGALGNAANTLRFENGGTLLGGSTARAIHTTGGMGNYIIGGSGGSLSGNITGDGGMAFDSVTLSGQNSFAGGLLASGFVRFNADSNLGIAGGRILLRDGGLELPADYTLARPVELLNAAASIKAPLGQTHLVSSDISGAGRLNLINGSFTLSGNNSHADGVALNQASLVLDSDARLGASAGAFNSAGGTLIAGADLAIGAGRSSSFTALSVDSNGFDVAFNQALNGNGLSKTGAGSLRLNNVNTHAAGNEVRVLQGSLQIGIDNALGTRAAVRQVASASVLDLAGHTLGLTELQVDAGGRVLLGSTGSLMIESGGQVDGSIEGAGRVVLAGNPDPFFTRGTLRLNNANNSFSGSWHVQGGETLELGHAQALGGAGSRLLLDGGTLATGAGLSGSLVVAAAMPVQLGANGGTMRVFNSPSLIIDAQLSGAGALHIMGGSGPGEAEIREVRLANTANNFVGTLRVGDAKTFGDSIVGITADGSLGAAGNRLTLGDRHFDGENDRGVRGGLRAWADLSLAADRVLQLDGVAGESGAGGWIDSNGFMLVMQGGITELSAGMGLLKTGLGSLVLNGQNSYTGMTVVQQGVLGGHGSLASVLIGADAVLAPGESAGLLSITGDLRFDAGQLQIELAGQQRGIDFDALNVGGAVDLGGSVLTLDFLGAFASQVHAGDSFELMRAVGGLTGQFANVASGGRLLTVDGEGSFMVSYGGGQALLLSAYQATAVPEPANWAMLLVGLAAFAGRALRRPPQVLSV